MSLPRPLKAFSIAALTAVAGVSTYALAQYTPPQAPPQQYPPQQYPPQQYPPGQPPQQYQPQQPQAQQLDPQARQELEIELKKAQIQTTLADRVAAMKEDYIRRLQEKHADEAQVYDAQADAVGARAGAESAKINTQILTIQLQSGQAIQPPPPGVAAAANSPILQILQLEVKKAQIGTNAQRQMVSVRQKQVDRLMQSQAAPEALVDAQIDLETAKAMTEVATLDEQLASARYRNVGGR